jgi:hypothetical protein
MMETLCGLGAMRLRFSLAALAVLAGVAAHPAAASASTPQLLVDTVAAPTHFGAATDARCEGDAAFAVPRCDAYEIKVMNVTTSAAGAPVLVRDTVPSGLTVNRIGFFWSGLEGEELGTFGHGEAFCKRTTATCELPASLERGQTLEMVVYVTVGATTGKMRNTVSVSAGGMRTVAASTENEVNEAPAGFGVESGILLPSGEDGAPDTTAGGHPYQLTSLIDLRTAFRVPSSAGGNLADSVEDVKDVAINLPLGFLGGAEGAPKCELSQLASPDGCPTATVVGHLTSEPRAADSVDSPIYNMVPEQGQVAEFGYVDLLKGTHVLYAHVVATSEGYVLQTVSRDVPQVPLTEITAVFYGDPTARDGSGNVPVAMFTNPSTCSNRPLATRVYVDSWQRPGPLTAQGFPNVEDPRWVESTFTGKNQPEAADESIEPVFTSGCNALSFATESFASRPETGTADTPTGLNVDIRVPQPENPSTLASPPLRNATVTLPVGLSLDPAVADGLEACTESQVGWLGGGLHDFNGNRPECPAKSKLGTVELESPLIGGVLNGGIYLAQPFANPYGTRYAAYIAIDDERTGVVVKIPGEILPDENTGQITSKFEDNPQFPFSDLRLHFFGGSRGDLATPEGCGTYTTTTDLEPWSAPESGPDATPSDSFPVNTGCVSGFTPAFSAGTANNQAGAFSTFTLSFSRQDSEEGPAGLTVSLPRGLLGKIAGVAECPDAQIAAAAANSGAAEQGAPSCPSASQLGSVATATGPGPNPFVSGGKAYLTGPYKGAPYGIVVVVPAVAGPFDLGTVVIRQALFIDPNDAHVTDVSDPLPRILKGIPLRIKRVSVTLDRPEFTFNPTSCEVKTIAATVTSIGGAHAPVSSRFQAAGCASLPFRPHLSASTLGHTSKANGASLRVRIASAGVGQAGVAKVELTIPSILPSRLTTLQKACGEAQFNANPAGCPSASNIATAVVLTPVLPDPLSGPVYFVSHGAAAFPDTEIILQGDGVTLILDGHTQIKNGVTYSRFETVPDAPFTSFEFNAPEGRYSIFSANGNLCHTEVRMPTSITAQNGAVLNQSTLVEPEGCPDALTVISHRVKGRTVTLKVAVPGAGKLTAVGRHLTKVTKTARNRSTVTLSLKANRRGKLASKVSLTFTPSKGRKLRAAVTARFTK